MGATVISTGLDGKPSIWPASAISRDKHGVFRDYKGNVVGVGTAMDSAVPTKNNATGVDAFAEHIADKLLAALQREDDAAIERQVKATMAMDNAEQEQRDLFGEPETEDEDTSFADALVASTASSKAHWDGVRKRSAERLKTSPTRTNRYAPSGASAAKAADSLTQLNAKRSKSFSMFNSAKAIIKRQRKSA